MTCQHKFTTNSTRHLGWPHDQFSPACASHKLTMDLTAAGAVDVECHLGLRVVPQQIGLDGWLILHAEGTPPVVVQDISGDAGKRHPMTPVPTSCRRLSCTSARTVLHTAMLPPNKQRTLLHFSLTVANICFPLQVCGGSAQTLFQMLP